jgi:hypothetical protein
MAIDFPNMREKVFSRYPFLRSSYFERRMLFERNCDRPPATQSLPEFPCERASVAPRS